MEFKNNKITVKSPAKINLHLEVLGKRKDGFHELSMIMQSINLSDYLEMENNNSGELILSTDCNELCSNDDNLIIKAANILIKSSNKKNLGANIYLKKNIPIGAGLAGGSSNAAATLVGLNKLWDLNLNIQTLHELAAEIGSDVPFCINGGSQYCFGRGEILEEFLINPEYAIILLKNPKISISTSEVYGKYSNKFSEHYISSSNSIEEKRKELRDKGFFRKNIFQEEINIINDLQEIVQNENSSVNESLKVLSSLEKNLCFSMSGSGPSCYAIFENYEEAKKVYRKNYQLFDRLGFNSWVCNFLAQGVHII